MIKWLLSPLHIDLGFSSISSVSIVLLTLFFGLYILFREKSVLVRIAFLLITITIVCLNTYAFLSVCGMKISLIAYIPLTLFLILAFYLPYRHREIKITTSLAMEKIIATMNDMLIICDLNLKIVFVNWSACAYLKYSESELVGKHISMLFNASVQEHMMDLFNQFTMVRDYESSLCAKDGEGIDVRLSISNVRDSKKRVVGAVLVGRDVRESLNLGKVLTEGEEKLKFFVEHCPAPIAMLNKEMRFIMISRRWSLDYGLGNQEIIGKSYYEIFPETPERWKEVHRRCLEGAVERCDQDPFIRLNGSVDWVRWEIHPWRTDKGLIQGVVVFTEVITAQKRAEEMLIEKEEYFKRFSEAAFEGVMIHSKGKIIEVNSSIAKMFGCETAEMIGKSYLDFIASDDHKRLTERIQSGTEEPCEALGVRTDGSKFRIEMRGKNIKLGDKQIRVDAVRDISEFKKAEEALNLQSKVLDSAANAMLISDREGNILWVNRSFMQMTGYSLKEIVGKNPRFLKSEQQSETFYGNLWRTILSGNVWHGELFNKRKDGSIYPADETITPVMNDLGEVTHFIAIQQDITERRRLENVKDEFLSNMSHEVRTPITVIKEAIFSLRDDRSGQLTKEQDRLVDITLRNVDRLGRIINDILDLSRIESSKAKIMAHRVDVAVLIQEAIENVKDLAEKKKIIMELDLPTHLPMVIGDDVMIVRVISNILDNALRYAKEKITIRAKMDQGLGGDEALEQHSQEANYIKISIIDDGPGIDEKNLKEIFDKFVQIHRPAGGTGYKGTGLGLAISKGIIKLLGGRIWAENEPGSGAQFNFIIPIEGKYSF